VLAVAACRDASPPPPPAPAVARGSALPAEPALQTLPADATKLVPSLPGDELAAPAISHGVRVIASRCIAAADLADAEKPYVDDLVVAGWEHVASRGGTITADRAPDRIQIILAGLPNGPCALPGHYRATILLTRPST
jgi:hypothetical protein